MLKDILNLLITLGLAVLALVSVWAWWCFDAALYPPAVRYPALGLTLVVMAGMIAYDWTHE